MDYRTRHRAAASAKWLNEDPTPAASAPRRRGRTYGQKAATTTTWHSSWKDVFMNRTIGSFAAGVGRHHDHLARLQCNHLARKEKLAGLSGQGEPSTAPVPKPNAGRVGAPM